MVFHKRILDFKCNRYFHLYRLVIFRIISQIPLIIPWIILKTSFKKANKKFVNLSKNKLRILFIKYTQKRAQIQFIYNQYFKLYNILPKNVT